MDVYKYLGKKLSIPENWDKYDYETQRYSFDDIAEILHEVVNKNDLLPDVSDLLIAFYQHLEKNGEDESCLTYKQEVDKFLAIYRR